MNVLVIFDADAEGRHRRELGVEQPGVGVEDDQHPTARDGDDLADRAELRRGDGGELLVGVGEMR